MIDYYVLFDFLLGVKSYRGVNNMKKISDSELVVMEIIWNSKKALSRYELTNILNNEPYNKKWCVGVVSTYVTRLCNKDVLESKKDGKLFKYFAKITKNNYNKELINAKLRDIFGMDLEELILDYANADYNENNIKKVKKFINKL